MVAPVDSFAESAWGADLLERYGGFRNLRYDDEAQYRSSLTPNGTVKWSLLDVKPTKSSSFRAQVSLDLSFPLVDWTFLQQVYGWAALQYQAWARGEIVVTGQEPRTVVLYTDHLLEYWVDDEPYFGGDYYAYRRAPPVLYLNPGRHRLDLRLVRDVRAMGGLGKPTIQVDLELRTTSGDLEVARDSILVADLVDRELASPLAAVALRNSGHVDIEVTDVVAIGVSL